MNRPRTRLGAVLVACAVVATACSGDDDTVSPTTASAPPESTASTVTTVPETTSIETTTPEPTTPSTDASTTSSTTTEVAPPTTDQPADSTQSLRQDAMDGDDALFDVLADPSAPGVEDKLRAYFIGEALEIALGLLDQFRSDDLIVEANPTVKRTFVPIGEPRLLDSSDNLMVEVETCRLDSDIVLAFVNGTDTRVVVNETITRTEALSTFELVDGTWRLDSWSSTSEAVGDQPCD